MMLVIETITSKSGAKIVLRKILHHDRSKKPVFGSGCIQNAACGRSIYDSGF